MEGSGASGAHSDLQDSDEREYSVKLLIKNIPRAHFVPAPIYGAVSKAVKFRGKQNLQSLLKQAYEFQSSSVVTGHGKVCHSCHAENPPEAIYCTQCSVKIQAAATEKGKVCPSCQFENDPGAIFCRKCTNKFQITPEANDQHTCLSCGTVMKLHDRCCYHCGTATHLPAAMHADSDYQQLTASKLIAEMSQSMAKAFKKAVHHHENDSSDEEFTEDAFICGVLIVHCDSISS